jgi:hypothetical protein
MKASLQGFAAGVLILALAGCGGGGTTAPSNQAAQSITGTMVKTSASSITVNGKAFDVSHATIRVNRQVATAADLRNGMRVQVKGRSTGGGNEASEVESNAEVRGAVTAVSAGGFSIGTVNVIVDTTTVFENLTPASIDAIKVGVVVEVHGTHNAAGDIVATRVEGKPAASGGGGAAEAANDEVRGAVTAVGADSITIGTTVATVSATTVFAPAATCSLASIKVGAAVEAHGTFSTAGAFTATRIECEDQDENPAGAGNGEANEVEGLVSGLDKTTRSFTLDTQAVTYSDTTRFTDGTVDLLANDVRVEVKGTMNGTTLVATEIEIKAKP